MWTELVNFYWWMIASPQHAVLALLLLVYGVGIAFTPLINRIYESYDKAASALCASLCIMALVGVAAPAASNASDLGGVMVILGASLFFVSNLTGAIGRLAAK